MSGCVSEGENHLFMDLLEEDDREEKPCTRIKHTLSICNETSIRTVDKTGHLLCVFVVRFFSVRSEKTKRHKSPGIFFLPQTLVHM